MIRYLLEIDLGDILDSEDALSNSLAGGMLSDLEGDIVVAIHKIMESHDIPHHYHHIGVQLVSVRKSPEASP